MDLIKRAVGIFGEVIVAVGNNPHKKPIFSAQERLKMLKEATKDMDGVTVERFSGLIVDYARKKHSRVIIRGLRMVSDFEYEFQMALTNRKLSQDAETVFLMPSESYSYLSSNLLKETAALDADLSSFVPAFVEKALKKRLRAK